MYCIHFLNQRIISQSNESVHRIRWRVPVTLVLGFKMILSNFNYDSLIAAKVSPNLAKVLTNPNSFANNLDIIIGNSKWDYCIPKDVTSVVPMYGGNSDMLVRWERLKKLEYAKIHHDGDDWRLIASSEQGLMAHILFNYYEMCDGDLESIEFVKQLSQTMGFVHLDTFWKWVNNNLSDEKWILKL